MGRHGLSVRAFVARRPEQNHGRRLSLAAGAQPQAVRGRVRLDALGDIYLTGKVPLEQISRAEVDRLLGVVAATADASFNVILELGFADSIRREWAWRRSRGESTANLAAFPHLDPGPDTPSP